MNEPEIVKAAGQMMAALRGLRDNSPQAWGALMESKKDSTMDLRNAWADLSLGIDGAKRESQRAAELKREMGVGERKTLEASKQMMAALRGLRDRAPEAWDALMRQPSAPDLMTAWDQVKVAIDSYKPQPGAAVQIDRSVLDEERINSLEAGSDADTLVAYYVMGWDPSVISESWAPSRDGACASIVVKRMRDLGASRILIDEAPSTALRPSFIAFTFAGVPYSAVDSNVSLAICKAALRAVGALRQAEKPPALAAAVNIRREKGEYNAPNSGVVCVEPAKMKKVMNDQDIDALTAGNWLDSLVAVHVMGWCADTVPYAWSPSTNKLYADEVIRQMKAGTASWVGFTRVRLDEGGGMDGRSLVAFGGAPMARGATLTEAVCKAALKAVRLKGVRVEYRIGNNKEGGTVQKEDATSQSYINQLRNFTACPRCGGPAAVALTKAATCDECALLVLSAVIMSQPAVGTRFLSAQKDKTFDDLFNAAAVFVNSRRNAAPGPDSARTWEQFFALASAVKNVDALKAEEAAKSHDPA